MSYHQQRQWQKLVGVIDTGVGKPVNIQFQLASLNGKLATVELREVTLRPAEIPDERSPRERKGATLLVKNNQANAVIVYPAGQSQYQNLANEIQKAIAVSTGVELPIFTDVEVTDENHPLIRADQRNRHLIILGRLGINRALWPAYNRFLAATDGYYPGGDGYVVRTAANVYRDGYNHIILGGSSDAGAKRAAEKFIEIIAKNPQNKGDFVLPWLLDVELGGACRDAFDARDAMWENDPFDGMLPKVEPGYGTVRRWYQNAMGYYWSGREGAKKRAQQMIEPVLADMSYTHHYIGEFMVRTWDMLDDSDVYTDAQRAKMDTLIQNNFWDFLSGPDLRWMTVFSPPYDNLGLVNRHQISPWAADLYTAEFVRDYLNPAGDLKELAEFRASEKNSVMRYLVSERWAPSPPEGELVETLEETVITSFRYALDHEQYIYFDRDHARKSLHLPRINHRTGTMTRPGGMVDTHLVLGKLASYYRDGRYLTLLNELPKVGHPMGPFQGRYVNGVHCYTPGDELQPQPLDDFVGVFAPAMQPHTKTHLRWFEGGLFKLPKIDPDEVIDFAVFRGGFTPDDDYFFLNGSNASAHPGSIVTFSSRDVSWFGGSASSLYSPPSEQYFDHNAVHVLRTDQWRDEADGYPAVAKRQWVAAIDKQSGGAAMSLEPFMGTRWTRQVFWIQSGLFIVRDKVTALNPGEYQIAITWRPGGSPAWKDGVWTSRSGSSELRITPLSEKFTVWENLSDFRAGRTEQVNFKQVSSAKLDHDQAIENTTVLQALRPGKESAYQATQVDKNTLVLKGGNESDTIAVLFGEPVDGPLVTDAEALFFSNNQLRIIEGKHVVLRGQTLWQSDKTQSTCITLEGEHAKLAADYLRETSVRPAHTAESQKESASQALVSEDRTTDWSQTWSYDGLLRATLVRGVRAVSDEVVDLGRIVELDEVRAPGGQRFWSPQSLPQPIMIATPDAQGGMPPLDSDLWQTLDIEPQWYAGVATGNYGGATPQDKDLQYIRPGGIKARYVRAAGAARLMYFDRSQQQSRRDMLIETADVDGNGSMSIFVKPDIWPKFVRKRYMEDDAVALLDASGQERFQAESATDYQSAKLIDYLGNGRKQIALLNVNGLIEIVSPDGDPVLTLNLYDMLQDFNEREGRPNTRHPAGGLPMPYDLGVWRRGSNGAGSLLVSRYGAMSFIDPQGRHEGVLMTGGYVTPEVLDESLDFDGDGVDEQLVLSRGNLLKIGGELNKRVTDPSGSYFYPQIYNVTRKQELAWSNAIDGSKPLAFEPVQWAGTKRIVFVARDNYLGLYDGKRHLWVFEWVPLTRLTGVALAESTDNQLTLLATTADGLLWRLSWQGILNDKPKFTVERLADPVKRLAAHPNHTGPVALIGEDGVYILDSNGSLRLIATGSFVDAALLPIGVTDDFAVVATTTKGEVERFDPKQ